MKRSEEKLFEVRKNFYICAQTFGDDKNPPVLLICGIGSQLLTWPEALCVKLAENDLFIIRHDSRDVGKSTWLTEYKPPAQKLLRAKLKGEDVELNAPYLLKDMAEDAALLLDQLNIQSAHIIGASLGGMVAQTLVIEFPERCRSLTSMMSTTSQPGLPAAKPHAMAALLMPTPKNRNGFLERTMLLLRATGSPASYFDEELVRDISAKIYERAENNVEGFTRQFAAILASGSRKEALSELRIKALVLHGAKDPLLPVECGEDTADSIWGSEFVVIENMGHDMPRRFWPQIVEAFLKVIAKGEREHQWRVDFRP